MKQVAKIGNDKYGIIVIDYDNQKIIIDNSFKRELLNDNLNEADIVTFKKLKKPTDGQIEDIKKYDELYSIYEKSLNELNSFKTLKTSNPPEVTVSEEVIPYYVEYSDYIEQRWETESSKSKLLLAIEQLKSELASSDYKVTKCYEASLTGEEMPYDVVKLTTDRNTLRTKINELETKL